jgi:purine-nucleoside phosphorylase
MGKILGANFVWDVYCSGVIVARHMDIETFGTSIITDMGNEESY